MKRLVRFHAGLSSILRPHNSRTRRAELALPPELVIRPIVPLGCVVDVLGAPSVATEGVPLSAGRLCLTRRLYSVEQGNSMFISGLR